MDFKIIQDEINKSIKEGEDFLTLFNDTNKLYGEIRTDEQQIKYKSIKLMNILLKKSRREVWFSFRERGVENTYYQNYKIGVNSKGLGLMDNYRTTLESLECNSYRIGNFITLCKDEDFVRQFLLMVSEKYDEETLKIVCNCLKELNIFSDKNIEISKNLILGLRDKKIYMGNSSDYSDEIKLINNEQFERGFELDDDNKRFREITKNYLDVDLREVIEFFYLIKHKGEVIPILKKFNKDILKHKNKIKPQLDYVSELLKPYEALQEI